MSANTKFIGGLLWLTMAISSLPAAERPTLVHTADPRPDILPRPFYEAHTEYRRRYNRPRNVSGWIARWISPTSQEGMVWYENKQAGSYARHHMPPRYKQFFVPKPWEALQTSARPDFPRPEAVDNPAYTAPDQMNDPVLNEELRNVPETPQDPQP